MGLKALVVDDEMAVRRLTVEMLERMSYAVVDVKDAIVAFDILKAGGKFDLVVSDFRMPGMTGIELHRRLAQASLIADMKFVLMTGELTDNSEIGAYCADKKIVCLSKPFGFVSFREAIQKEIK